MFKKALVVGLTFGGLVGLHMAYVQAYGELARRIRMKVSVPLVSAEESKSSVRATALVIRAFGPNHWAAGNKLALRYYSADRGYWFYAQSYELTADRKQLTLAPFAMVWEGQGGKELQTAESKRATIDLDQPFVSLKGSNQPSHVTHARIEEDVVLRDTRGTAATEDDLTIGPLTYLEFDDAKLQIVSDSPVTIRDKGMWVTGIGLKIDLWPKPEPEEGAKPVASDGARFDGAKTAWLERDVHIFIKDVGRSAFMPGTRAEPQVKPGEARPPTPIDLRAAGPMRVDLPRPKPKPAPGEPIPEPEPTFVQFTRNVVVRRGGEAPDQLNSDDLKLLLLPAPKTPDKLKSPAAQAKAQPLSLPVPKPEVGPPRPEDQAVAKAAPAPEGPLNDLTLRRAEANGHAVWLQSVAQGIKARCNVLIFEKLSEGRVDRTYLKGDNATKLYVEKIERRTGATPAEDAKAPVAEIWAIDATIYDDGPGGEAASVVSRGPGKIQTRPARGRPIERQAAWADQLTMYDRPTADGIRRQITLTGTPWIEDPKSGRLDAGTKILAYLKPKPEDPKKKDAVPKTDPKLTPRSEPAAKSDEVADAAFEIERMEAYDNVRFQAPDRSMQAEDRLDVIFVTPPAPVGSSPAESGEPKAVAVASSPEPQPSVKAQAKAREGAPPAPVDKPDVSVQARYVWAEVTRSSRPPTAARPKPEPAGEPGSALLGEGSWELKRALLRGKVAFHQDPESDQERGIDVTGEAIDADALGDGLMKLTVSEILDPRIPRQPGKVIPPARLVTSDLEVEGSLLTLDQKKEYATVEGAAHLKTPDLDITGPLLTLNQKTEVATVEGAGQLIQRSSKGGFELAVPDVGPAVRKASHQPGEPTGKPAAAEKSNTGPTVITWKKRMIFRGRSMSAEGELRPAQAEFHGDAHLENKTTDARAQLLEAYFDDVIPFRGAMSPKPKRDPKDETAGAEKPKPREIIHVRGTDDVVFVQRKLDANGVLLEMQKVEGPTAVVDRRSATFQVTGMGQFRMYDRKTDKTAKPKPVALRPMIETRVTFRQAMHGMFNPEAMGRRPDPAAKKLQAFKWAEFYGDARAIHAVVADTSADIDFDDPPRDFQFMTARKIRLDAYPPEPGAKVDASDRLLLDARGDATARSIDSTIQGDRITYESEKELIYVYGNEVRDVVIAQSKSPGQPPSYGRASAVMYNRKTGQSQVFNPKGGVMIDPKAGVRPAPEVSKPEQEKKPSRIRQMPRSSNDRGGYGS